MVNYDLPWNPTRIDQRIGRLHRYGQDRTVEIRNLFINNTRESIILESLLDKIGEIEDTLGMSSDVLGLVLEDVDLEQQIMAALTQEDNPETIADDIESIVENQQEAVRHVDEDLLIRDQFDLSREDRDILDIVDESAEDTVSEADVEYLVRTVCQEFDGGIVNVRPGLQKTVKMCLTSLSQIRLLAAKQKIGTTARRLTEKMRSPTRNLSLLHLTTLLFGR